MTKLYRAKSLDDISKQFREKAKTALDNMNRASKKDMRNYYSGQVTTWNAAADMLENMEIVEN